MDNNEKGAILGDASAECGADCEQSVKHLRFLLSKISQLNPQSIQELRNCIEQQIRILSDD